MSDLTPLTGAASVGPGGAFTAETPPNDLARLRAVARSVAEALLDLVEEEARSAPASAAEADGPADQPQVPGNM